MEGWPLADPKVQKKGKLKDRHAPDWFLLILTMVLVGLGLLVLFSASYYAGNVNRSNGYYYVASQIQGIVLGMGALFFLTIIDYRILRKKPMLILIYLFSIFLLLACFIPGIGKTINGSTRWIKVAGTSVQTSDIAKYGVIIVLSGIISRFTIQRMGSFFKGLLPLFFIALSIAGIIVVQPDFGMAAIVIVACVSVMLVGGMRFKHFILICIVGGIGAFLIFRTQQYRSNRIAIFFDPFVDLPGASQVRNALYAIASGGFFGKGFDNSTAKRLWLAQGESDFIVSIIVEEYGVIGCLVLMVLFCLLIMRGYKIANECKDRFGRACATGITTIFGLQAVINIGVGTLAIPTTGVTLPLVSFGSSSMACTLAAIGLLLSISRNTKALEQPRIERSDHPRLQVIEGEKGRKSILSKK